MLLIFFMINVVNLEVESAEQIGLTRSPKMPVGSVWICAKGGRGA